MALDTKIGSQQRSVPNNVIKDSISHKGLSSKIKKTKAKQFYLRIQFIMTVLKKKAIYFPYGNKYFLLSYVEEPHKTQLEIKASTFAE